MFDELRGCLFLFCLFVVFVVVKWDVFDLDFGVCHFRQECLS